MPEFQTSNGVSVLFDNNTLDIRPGDPPVLSFKDGNLVGVHFEGYRISRKTHEDEERERCETILVRIPDFLEVCPSGPDYVIDDEGRRCLHLDAHIVPALEALWKAGIATTSCCCGHGNRLGAIWFPRCDGRGEAVARDQRSEGVDG